MNIKRFSNFPQSIDPVKSQTILEQFLELNNNFGVLNENLQAIDANFEQVQEEFATLENEFAETQRKVNSLESEIGTLPAQVAQNTSDIAQNTSDIAELKQREDKQGTIVKVNGQAVATWSPDIMSTDIATNRDNIQQVTQAQASDSLAIVALQSDNITNKQNISSLQTNVSSLNSDNTTNKSNISALQTNVSDLQGDVTTLNQQQARSLKTPTTAPTETELVGVDSTNSQVLIPLSQIGGGGGGSENIVEFAPTSDTELKTWLSTIDKAKIRYFKTNSFTSLDGSNVTWTASGITLGVFFARTLIGLNNEKIPFNIHSKDSFTESWTFSCNFQDYVVNVSISVSLLNQTISIKAKTLIIPSAESQATSVSMHIADNQTFTYDQIVIGYVQ